MISVEQISKFWPGSFVKYCLNEDLFIQESRASCPLFGGA